MKITKHGSIRHEKLSIYQMQVLSGIEVLEIIKTYWTGNHLFWGSSEFKELQWHSSVADCIPAK